MKKNILAVAILAAVIANIILTCVTLFSIVPAAKATNNLINRICTVINLDLENPDAADYVKVPIENRVPLTVKDSNNEIKMMINLKKAEGESKPRMAQVALTIVLNSQAKNYGDVSAVVDNQMATLATYFKTLCMEYTGDALLENQDKIKSKMLSYCRTYFRDDDTTDGSDLVVDVNVDLLVMN